MKSVTTEHDSLHEVGGELANWYSDKHRTTILVRW
jgi:hypothetical protein